MPPLDKPAAYFGLLNVLRTILGTEGDLVMVGALKNSYIRDDKRKIGQSLLRACWSHSILHSLKLRLHRLKILKSASCQGI
jgi:hypothetical protein